MLDEPGLTMSPTSRTGVAFKKKKKREDFGKRECEEGYTRTRERGWGQDTLHVFQKKRRGRHDKLGYCSSAPKAGVCDRDMSGWDSLSVKVTGKTPSTSK